MRALHTPFRPEAESAGEGVRLSGDRPRPGGRYFLTGQLGLILTYLEPVTSIWLVQPYS